MIEYKIFYNEDLYMYYVIMDLEWNNVYMQRLRGFMNEIIEIGAVLADENLHIVDRFSCLIKPVKGKKLTSRVKKLTHITNEDLKTNGTEFEAALRDFKSWLPNDRIVFVSWGTSDLRAMLDNYRFFFGGDNIPFVKEYLNAQNYCQSYAAPGTTNQIGLSAAAESLGVSTEQYQTHRALDDSYIALDCLKQCYDSEKIDKYISVCDKGFYKRLCNKAVVIKDIDDPVVDPNYLMCRCDLCDRPMTRQEDWRFSSSSGFKTVFGCDLCGIYKRYAVKIVSLADGTDVKISVRNAYEINKPEEQNEPAEE